MNRAGMLMCIASAACFGSMAIFGKLLYDEGATVGTLLALRFAIAAVLFWLIAAMSGGLGALRLLSRRDLRVAVALGALGYALQASAYFAALRRIDASLLALLLYTFPAIVTVASIVLGRERAERRLIGALALSSSGLILVVAGAGTGALDPLGVALALAAACVYSAYILVSEGVSARVRPQLLSALVCSGAAVTLTIGSLALGQLQPGDLTAAGWGWMGCIAVISTVAAVSLFFAGLRRAGASSAAILSTVEPLVTVLLAYLVFGEHLTGPQMLGGALVLGGVVALSTRPRSAAIRPPHARREAGPAAEPA